MAHKRLGKVNMYWFCIGIIFIALFQPCISWAYEKEIRELSSVMAENIAKAGKTRIAVVDFTDLQGNVTELGRFIAEELAVALLDKKQGFEIVDRTHLQTLIKEHKLSATGLIDPATAQKLGQIAGVDALVTGSITPFGDSIRISVKILDITTAKLIGAVAANIPKTKAVEELLERGIGNGLQMDTGNSTPSSPISSGKAVEVEGFIFKPGICTRKGSDTICNISIMNNGDEDRELLIFSSIPKSSLIDNFGNKYEIDVKIGSRNAGYGSGYISEKFLPKLFVNASFFAKDVTPEATHCTVIIGIDNFKSLVSVRNIPIIK
ncbi:MAG TPA: FlgO family outer membrane protein [Candidatus Deferrimicrobium sp.]|nr:FlgO family outer membrane protein [Candidatus Deferrimicrobium sp.]